MTRLTLYGKPGCHLCEEAHEVVLQVQQRQPVQCSQPKLQAWTPRPPKRSKQAGSKLLAGLAQDWLEQSQELAE